jgi:capsular polysaccharide biosynthesis protein
MSSGALDLLKILGAFVGAVIGALGAVFYKEYLDKKRALKKGSSRHAGCRFLIRLET